jgi:uncharacterized protein (TIGR03435 family)
MRAIIAVFVFVGTIFVGTIFVGIRGLALRAQSPAGAAPLSRPEFEAAAISPSGVCEGGGAPRPGRLRLRCITVGALIQMAYGYFANGISYTPKILQIFGAPGWVDSDRYDIEATAEGNPSQALMRGPMLEALLEDRFRLRFHRETKGDAVYALTVARGGIRMARMGEGSCTPADLKRLTPGSSAANLCGTETRKRNGQMLTVSVHGISVADLADGLLVELAGRTVIDKTGISGLFDFHVEFSPEQNSATSTDDAAGPSIFTALQEQPGLKLESARGPVKLFAIDHVERPSGN